MKTNTTTNLKRTIPTAVGGLLFIALLTAGMSAVGNQLNFIRTAQAQEKTQADPIDSPRRFRCNVGTLSGEYAVIGNGFAAPPPNLLLPFATVSLMTLDGAGNLSNKVTRSNNGQISRGVDSGTYNVNPDCTGTITIITPNPPFQLTFDLVVANLQGRQGTTEFYFIATTPGGAITSIAKRIQ